MARRVCLYCRRDYGEALPRESWSMYPEDLATHGVCPSPACQAAQRELTAALRDERPLAGVPVES